MTWRKLFNFGPSFEWNGWATLVLMLNVAAALYNLVGSWRPDLLTVNAAALVWILWMVRPQRLERRELQRLIRAWEDRQARAFEDHIVREQIDYEQVSRSPGARR